MAVQIQAFVDVDYKAADAPLPRAESLLISQYQNSTNLKTFINIIVEEFNPLYKAMQDCNELRYIETAVGKQLDWLAEIVGSNRVIAGAASYGYYGFYEEASSLGMGDETDSDLGGILRSEGEDVTGDLKLTDSQLRRVIRAKILKNSSRCTTEDIIRYIELLLGRDNTDIEITHPAAATTRVTIHESLDVYDRTLLAATLQEIKPAGVGMRLFDNSGEITLLRIFKAHAYGARKLEELRTNDK